MDFPALVLHPPAQQPAFEQSQQSQLRHKRNVLPNIYDPKAVNPQTVCPGYRASNIVNTPHGLIADLTLAGTACNVYGTDIDNLKLTVEYQSEDRLHIYITPTYVTSENRS